MGELIRAPDVQVLYGDTVEMFIKFKTDQKYIHVVFETPELKLYLDANPDVMQFTETQSFFRRQNNCLKINNPNLPDGLYCVSIGAIQKGSSETISNFTLFDFRNVDNNQSKRKYNDRVEQNLSYSSEKKFRKNDPSFGEEDARRGGSPTEHHHHSYSPRSSRNETRKKMSSPFRGYDKDSNENRKQIAKPSSEEQMRPKPAKKRRGRGRGRGRSQVPIERTSPSRNNYTVNKTSPSSSPRQTAPKRFRRGAKTKQQVSRREVQDRRQSIQIQYVGNAPQNDHCSVKYLQRSRNGRALHNAPTFVLKSRMIPKLIGRKGSHINELKVETGAELTTDNFEKDNKNSGGFIHIDGSDESKNEAMIKMTDFIIQKCGEKHLELLIPFTCDLEFLDKCICPCKLVIHRNRHEYQLGFRLAEVHGSKENIIAFLIATHRDLFKRLRHGVV